MVSKLSLFSIIKKDSVSRSIQGLGYHSDYGDVFLKIYRSDNTSLNFEKLVYETIDDYIDTLRPPPGFPGRCQEDDMFIKYRGHYENVNSDFLYDICYDYGPDGTIDVRETMLKRINDDLEYKTESWVHLNDLEPSFNIIMTERIPTMLGAVTFKDFIEHITDDQDNIRGNGLQDVILLICYAIYILNNNMQIMHNDMHSENIYVYENQAIQYEYDILGYKVKSNYRIFIIDYDHATVYLENPIPGELIKYTNPLADDYLCDMGLGCNQNITLKDNHLFLKVLVRVYQKYRNSGSRKFLQRSLRSMFSKIFPYSNMFDTFDRYDSVWSEYCQANGNCSHVKAIDEEYYYLTDMFGEIVDYHKRYTRLRIQTRYQRKYREIKHDYNNTISVRKDENGHSE